MASTEQLEREAELSRAQLSASLDELRSITPGRLIDEILGYAKSGSTELVRGLGNQVVQHPLPATLIGAGLAWLIMSNSSSSKPHRPHYVGTDAQNSSWFSQTGKSMSSSGERLRDRAESAMQGIKENAQSAMEGVGDNINNTTGMVRDKAQAAMSSIGDSISGAYSAVSDTASRAVQAAADVTPSQDDIMQAGERVWNYCKDQPLVVAGLGIAIGAALGAAIPQTDAENRLMGDASDHLKEKAQNVAADPLRSANRVVSSVGERVLDDAAKFAKQELTDLVSGLGSREDSTPVQSDEQRITDSSVQGEPSQFDTGERPIH